MANPAKNGDVIGVEADEGAAVAAPERHCSRSFRRTPPPRHRRRHRTKIQNSSRTRSRSRFLELSWMLNRIPATRSNSETDVRSKGGWLAMMALMLGLAIAAGLWTPRLVGTLRHARALGAAAPLAFILVHTIGVVAFVPATVFAVAGGALFGLAYGALYSVIGGTCGALTAFLLGRHLVRQLFEARVTESARLAAVDRAVAARGARILFLMRLSPVMPFNILNYLLGIGSVRTVDFVVSSIGMVPGTLVAAYAGQVAGETLALAGQAHPVWNSSYYLALMAGFIATLLAAVAIGRAASRALKDMA